MLDSTDFRVLPVCASRSLNRVTSAAPTVAGFWTGLWQGFIAPFVFVISLLKSGLNIYEVHNNGAWYNLGYLFGVACVFGGGSHKAARR